MAERAWRITNDEYAFFAHAETRSQARDAYAAEYGLAFDETFECSVQVWPALDGMTLTMFNQMVLGSLRYWEAACPGCGRAIYAEQRGKEVFLGAYDDERAHKNAQGDLWCSWSCWAGKAV